MAHKYFEFILVFYLFHPQQFDSLCKAEAAFLISRAVINVSISMEGVGVSGDVLNNSYI